MTKLFRSVVVAICFLSATHPALALMAPASIESLRLGRDYPESVQKQIRNALQAEHCQFKGGRWINGHFQFEFGGDATALNGMLSRLADCPGTSVAVSFRKVQSRHDWQVDLDTRSMQFKVVVNLNSETIELDRLNIPASKAPPLES